MLFPFHCAYQLVCLFTWPSLKLYPGQAQKWVWVSDVTSDISSDASYCSCSSYFEYYQVFYHRDSLFIHYQAVAKSSNFTLQISTHCKRAISLETARNTELLQKITKTFPEVWGWLPRLWAMRGPIVLPCIDRPDMSLSSIYISNNFMQCLCVTGKCSSSCRAWCLFLTSLSQLQHHQTAAGKRGIWSEKRFWVSLALDDSYPTSQSFFSALLIYPNQV